MTTQSVLVHTLITKGSALSIRLDGPPKRRPSSAEPWSIADRLGEPYAMLRARNNLTGITDPQQHAGSIDLARESSRSRQRYGERTWVQQAIGSWP